MNWNTAANTIESLGRNAARPGSLAGLHQAKREHLGQFFTPDALVALMWRIVTPAMDLALTNKHQDKLNLLDNSVGSGKMFVFADPKKHRLSGLDIHAPSITALMDDAKKAGFYCDFVTASMDEVEPKGFHVALINPAFSLPLQSPLLKPYDCTSYGKYGPNTSTTTHAYALEQALDAAGIVLAVLPRTFAQSLLTQSPQANRLRAVIHLPARSFKEENTEVSVSLVVYGLPLANFQVIAQSITDLEQALPDLQLRCPSIGFDRAALLSKTFLEADIASITEPVTGDNTVRIVHSGRKLSFQFKCGLTRAQVMNDFLGGSVRQPEGSVYHRYPKGVRWQGQGAFDLELYFMQPDPMQALDAMASRIKTSGGNPVFAAGLKNFVAKRHRRNQRENTPYQHTILTKDGVAENQTVQATPKKPVLIDAKRWGSSVLKPTDTVTFTYTDGYYHYTHSNGDCLRLELEDLKKSFTLHDQGLPEWKQVHEGRVKAFPALAHQIRCELDCLAITPIISWDFQINDVIEMLMAPRGTIGFEMGLGKSRMLVALTLARGKHNLAVVESHLISEMVSIFEESGLDKELYQVITTPEQCQSLKKINIISYNRLRMPIAQGAGRRTYASLLRRRIHTVVADEAHLLRNSDTQQTKAVMNLSPKVRYAMTGTPISNYCRDIYSLALWAKGDGTATQPYGKYHPYMQASMLQSMDFCEKGIEVFRERFVVTEWCTYQFEDTLKGAKRETPKVRNRELLRQWASTLLMRRTVKEPDVAKYVRTPEQLPPITHEIEFDQAHLKFYITELDSFRAWFVKQYQLASAQGNQVNLIALLARINAVRIAGNAPHHGAKGRPTYSPITSKQRLYMERLLALVAEGHKVVCYAENPELLNRMERELTKLGIESVVFHGGVSIKNRTKELNKRFRQGNVQVLLAGKKCVQTGLNIWQATRGLFYDRDWTSKTERQAMARLLRPQQTKQVQFEYFHLAGSLDIYQAQMCEFKADATDSVVDFLDSELDDTEFLHMDNIINQFIESCASKYGMKGHEYRDSIKAA